MLAAPWGVAGSGPAWWGKAAGIWLCCAVSIAAAERWGKEPAAPTPAPQPRPQWLVMTLVGIWATAFGVPFFCLAIWPELPAPSWAAFSESWVYLVVILAGGLAQAALLWCIRRLAPERLKQIEAALRATK